MPTRTTLIWNQDRVISRARGVMLARAQNAAEAAEQQVKARLGEAHPPASAPGQPPRRRTGALQRSIVGAVRATVARIRVQVSAAAPYARMLQQGTRKMAARPFLGLPIDARLIVDILSGRRRR
jgi:hypothetical protein